jgi:hypothetical protein
MTVVKEERKKFEKRVNVDQKKYEHSDVVSTAVPKPTQQKDD